ncbi:MAG TPA: efflux RND transporter periplasmic adaptor subunit [Patescibacteria group bacterium]|nr:efflux RND transporter periplasmic adaptor subunit [Patescibacteria group bacterium]
MRLKVVAIVALLVVGGAAIGVSLGVFTPSATSATSLLTATATVADVTDEIAATGTVETAWQYDLSFGLAPVEAAGSSSSASSASNGAGGPSVSWPVTGVKVAVGDHVTKGQVLATANTADLLAQIANARRAASSAALQLKQAKSDKADASGTAAKRQAQINLNNAESAEAKSKSDLAALEALRAFETITAPADGTITQVAISAGSDAPSGAAITMIAGTLQVTTNVVESDIAAIKLDQQATVTVSALDASLQGKVVAIAPVGSASGSNGVVAYPVTIALDAPPSALRPGMSADVSITAASATNVLSIPSRALSGAAGAYTVRVLAADGTVSVRGVEVGLVTSSLAEIKSGLQAGDRVVTGTSTSQSSTTTVGGGGAFPGGGFIRQGRP